MENYASIMFGSNARAAQDKAGMGERYAAVYEKRHRGPFDDDTRAFIQTRDSFYMASLSETGWPYVQHRGGPSGFLKLTGPEQIGFAVYGGNKQFISKGNLATNPRVSLILMDYPRRARLKLVGEARVMEADEAPDLELTLRVDGAAPAERLFLIDVIAMDWNCPKFITPRFSEAEIETMLASRLQELAQENQALKERLAELETARGGIS